MACGGCVASVQAALQAVPDVSSVEVSLSDGLAKISYDATQVTQQSLRDAVTAAGYGADIAA